MSMGSKLHGPSAPRVKGKTSRHPKFRQAKPVQAKSPRISAPLVSNAPVAMPGGPAEAGSTGTYTPLAGVMVDGAGRGSRMDTNANRRHGGTSTIYRPKPEDLAGGQRVTPPLTRSNVNAPARAANPRYDRATYQDTLAASEAAGFRERAMMTRSILITNGAVTVDRNTPVWMEGEQS